MPTSVIEQIRRVASEGLRDGELLGRFIDRRDEAALAALVNRHGPMVWGVCRRLLSHHDAEDAFQATFIVLVRKAASIAQRELLGNWLYGVAHQAALQARRSAARRRAREIQVNEMPDVEAQQDPLDDVRPILDEELSRLPDHYRAVIVLCDLEGRTRKEVARQFGCPEGTVASRLARAREMLAKRLAGRGVTSLPPGVVPPPSLLSTTINVALLAAAKQAAATGAISVEIAALTEGVMKAMSFTKLKSAIAVVLVLGLMAAGATLLTCRSASGQDDAKTAVAKSVPRVTDAKPDEELLGKQENESFTAWGEVYPGGVQVGLGYRPGEKRAYSVGETVTLAVRARNVGKKQMLFWYHRRPTQETPPKVTDAEGKTLLAPMKGQEVEEDGVADVALVPGAQADLYYLKFKLGPASERGDKAYMTIYGTGKFEILETGLKGESSLGKFRNGLQLGPMHGGKVELEVKEPGRKNDAGPAWGKEVDGLQMRLEGAQTVRHGETAKFAVKLRNVGKAEATVTYSALRDYAPGVTTNTGGRVSVYVPPPFDNYAPPIKRVIKPGETITLYNPQVAVESEALARLKGIMRVETPTICVAPGKYKVAYSGMIRSHPKLATGTVELEVKEAAKTLLKQPEQARRVFATSPKFDPRVLAYLADPVSGTIQDHNPEGMEIALGVGVRDGVRLGHAFQILAAGSKDSIGVAKVLELERGRCIAKIVAIDRSHAGKSLKGLTASCTSDMNKAAIQTRWGKNVWQTESLENKLIQGLLEKSEGTQIHVVQQK